MVALDAIVQTREPRGERSIPISDFYLLPSDHPERETVLEHGELITAVDLPALPFAERSYYLKVRDRASYAFALTSAAVALDIQGGTIRAARIALGGVGTKPSIGSGAIESTVKQVGRRLKISGAQWHINNLPQVLMHRCAYLNGQFSN